MKNILYLLFLLSFNTLAQLPTQGWNTANFGMALDCTSNHEFTVGDKIYVTNLVGGLGSVCGIGRYQDQNVDPNITSMNIVFPIWGYTTVYPYLPMWGFPLEYYLYDTLTNINIPIDYINWVFMYITIYGDTIYYHSGNNYHVNDIYMAKEIVVKKQNIPILEGWQMIGTYIYPQISLENVLSNIDVIIMKDDNGDVYVPSLNINNIGNFWPGEGYQIKCTTEDTLIIYGQVHINESQSFYTGWQMFSPKSYLSINAFNYFNGDPVIIWKDGYGNFSWPLYGVNNVPLLLPGKGYAIKCSGNFIN